MKQGERNIVEWSRVISQFSRDQLKCLSTNQPNDERTFRASTSIISCVRDRKHFTQYVLWTVCLTEKRSFGAIYGMIDGSRNAIFS